MSRSSTVPGTAQEERLQLSNFHPTPAANRRPTWLVGCIFWPDQRMELDHFVRHESSESLLESFEASMTTPPGWVIEGTWPDGWEIGQTRNTSGYGPGVFHSVKTAPL